MTEDKKIELKKESKEKLIESIKGFFIDQRGETIGDLQASMLADLLIEEGGKAIYNQGLSDALQWLKSKMEDIEGDYYSLEK